MTGWIVLLIVVLILLRMPIAAALGTATGIYLMWKGIPSMIGPQRILGTLQNELLVAIPMFLIAGRLMNLIGATRRIFDLSVAILGHVRGGLGYVVVLTSIIFSAMSGSATADAVGVGSITVQEMRRNGYDAEFAAAITLAASTLAPIIPPSIMFIVYSVTAEVSVGRLFLAGVLPGLLIAAALMVTVGVLSARRRYPIAGSFRIGNVWQTFRRAFLSLVTPVIILGGMFGGYFTATEAAVVAVDYVILLGLVYRAISWRLFYREIVTAGTLIGALMLIISVSGLSAWMFTMDQLPLHLETAVTSLTRNPTLIMLLLVLIGLILGTIMDAIPIILILVPALIPLINSVGIDPVHFGLVFVITTVIGLITPPVGMCLYGISAVAKLPIEVVFRATLPFFLALVLSVVALVFMPRFVLFLPNLLLGR